MDSFGNFVSRDMTRLEKLAKAEKDILNLHVGDNTDLFSRILPEKIDAFLALCIFEERLYTGMHQYLIRSVSVLKEKSEASAKVQGHSTLLQEYFLKSCKKHTSNLREEILVACELFIENKERLYREEE